MRISKTFIAVLLTQTLLTAPLLAEGKSIIVLDASGSMWGQIDGRPKRESAREALGAVLSFADNQLFLNTRRYLRDDDYERVSELLTGQLAEEEAELKSVKDNLQRLEHELFRRLHQLDRWPA